LKIREEIEAKAKMPITGIVGNANLMEETTLDVVMQGFEFCRRVADEGRIPLEFITVPAALLTRLPKNDIPCPILALKRQLVPPWKRAEPFGQTI
jgi:hypothetical protein